MTSEHSITIDGVRYHASVESIVRLYRAVLEAKAGEPKVIYMNVGESSVVEFVSKSTPVFITTTPDVLDVLGIERSAIIPLDDAG